MRRFVRSVPFQAMGRNTQPAYNPEANDQKLKNWSSKLNNLATSTASKMYLGQLGALVNYYNRAAMDTTKPINWDDWNSRIITAGLVDKVKQNYVSLSTQDYDLDKLFTDVFSRDSKAIDDINNEMAFHTSIWIDNYMDYVQFLTDLNTVSSPLDYNSVQWMDLHAGQEQRGAALIEVHAYLFGTTNDVNLWNYMVKQFAWGKRVTSFYRHPADDFKQGRATKNALGR